MPGRTVDTRDGPAGAATHALSRQGPQANDRSGDRTPRRRAVEVSSGVHPDK